jgi:hypothetical protein
MPFSFLLCVLHIPPSHPPWFDYPNNILWSVQIMRLLIIQSSPASCHSLILGSKFSPQHPVLKHPQSMFFLSMRGQVSYPYRTTGKVTSVCF